MIVIEGMDNSGKSTLARALADNIGLIVQESEGPPRSPEEMNARVDRYQEMEGRLFVRHPCISENIYGPRIRGANCITPGRMMLFYEAKPLLIYCDAGDRGMTGHERLEHDTDEHMVGLEREYREILTEYRLWAAQHAHLIYRIGDDMDEFCSVVAFQFHYRAS